MLRHGYSVSWKETRLFPLELCADRNQIMFIFAVTNNRLGMPWQKKKKKVFTEASLLFLHFTRTLPHKLTEDKLGSGTCEQMISSRTLKAVLATSRRGFHTVRLISEKTEHAWENMSASASAYRLRISYRWTGHATWRGGVVADRGGGAEWGRECRRHLSVAGKSGLISCSVVLIHESIIRRTCLCGPLSIWALAPSHAVLMASRDGVPNRSVIKSNWRREVSRKWERYKTE